MARLNNFNHIDSEPDMTSVLITAYLQQGIVLDKYHGLTLTGILVSELRKQHCEPGSTGSMLDGGLDTEQPQEWNLPLGKCVYDMPTDWHWAVTSGEPLTWDNVTAYNMLPDIHQITMKVDERRAFETSVHVPATVGTNRGRYRPRLRPVVVIPAAKIEWRAVGNPEQLHELLVNIQAIGSRRNIGEGNVIKWDISTVNDHSMNWFQWVHVNRFNMLGGLIPISCAQHTELTWEERSGGIRPPVFHPYMQRTLAGPIS